MKKEVRALRYILNREEMQAVDAYTIEELGIPSMVLMERAAMAVADRLFHYMADRVATDPVRVLVVTECGNNGGDALAVARILQEAGWQTDIFQIGGIQKESEQYRQQKKILERLGIPVCMGIPDEAMGSWEQAHYDIILDGIFGVGLHRDIQEPQRKVIEYLNQLTGYKCAIDMPSGIDSTDGRLLGIGFRADLTVTFGCEKTGQLIGAGPEYCGRVIIADIGFPKQVLAQVTPGCYCYERKDLKRLPVRNTTGNKGTFGRVTVIAGSAEVCGAAVLCAGAAYRTGCGLVEVITHENNREAVNRLLPEALLHVYSTREEAEQAVQQSADRADVMVVGPGIGTDEIGQALTAKALAAACPLIVDADAITILSRQEAWWKQRHITIPAGTEATGKEDLHLIITPHMKEMERISRIPMKQLKQDPWGSARSLAQTGAVCVLKDARTVVALPGEQACYMNRSGNDGMAVGGSGDVLAGILASLAAQGLPLGEAARLGVYLHGLAGDRAAEQNGHYGMLAGDIIEGVVYILKEYDKHSREVQ